MFCVCSHVHAIISHFKGSMKLVPKNQISMARNGVSVFKINFMCFISIKTHVNI